MEGAEGDDIGASFLTSDQYMVEGHTVHAHAHDDEDKDDVPHLLREQDRFLPIANVARIMKKGIPRTGKVGYNKVYTLTKFWTVSFLRKLIIIAILIYLSDTPYSSLVL